MPEPSTQKTVFYVDDDPDDLEFLKDAFSKQAAHIELKTFERAVDLLNYIHTQCKPTDPLPCLIILDINMPALSGKDALRLLRNLKEYNSIPVVLFSTSNAPQDVYFAKMYNAGFISKPLTDRHLDVIVDTFLQHCKEDVRK